MSVEEIIDLLSWYVDLWLDVKAKKLNLSEEKRKTEESMFSKGIELIEEALKILSNAGVIPKKSSEVVSLGREQRLLLPQMEIKIPTYKIENAQVLISIVLDNKRYTIGELSYKEEKIRKRKIGILRYSIEIGDIHDKGTLEEGDFLVIHPLKIAKNEEIFRDLEGAILVEFIENNIILIKNKTSSDVYIEFEQPSFRGSLVSF